jgi:hypothetical protein
LLHPQELIGDRITLAQAPQALIAMDKNRSAGMTIIQP